MLVGRRFLVIILVVIEARDSPAASRVHPKVARAGVRDNSECLSGGTNLNFSEVLSVHVVLEGDDLAESIGGNG